MDFSPLPAYECVVRYRPASGSAAYVARVMVSRPICDVGGLDLCVQDVAHKELCGYLALDMPFEAMMDESGRRLALLVREIHEMRVESTEDDMMALVLLLMRVWHYEYVHGPSVMGRSLRELLQSDMSEEGGVFCAEVGQVCRRVRHKRLPGLSVSSLAQDMSVA